MATTTQLEPTVFLWQGRDKRGTKLKGQQIATTPNLVRAELRRQGINPISVKKKPKPLLGGAGSRISAKDIAVFSRQLATMLKSGVPLVTSMQIISGGLKNPRMRVMVDKIRAEVESGSALTPGSVRRVVHQPGQGRRKRRCARHHPGQHCNTQRAHRKYQG
jgi:type IV pilus assembly protein PilC